MKIRFRKALVKIISVVLFFALFFLVINPLVSLKAEEINQTNNTHIVSTSSEGVDQSNNDSNVYGTDSEMTTFSSVPNDGGGGGSTSVDTIYLKAYVTSWRVYNVNTGAEVGRLNPSLFGGLTYTVITWLQRGLWAVINTESYGQVKIYLDGDAIITYGSSNTSPGGSTASDGDGLYLKANVTSWRVYNINSGAQAGILNPQLFGGLTYSVVRWLERGIWAVINTESFGQVKIYVDLDATVVYRDQYSTIPNWTGYVDGYFDLDRAVLISGNDLIPFLNNASQFLGVFIEGVRSGGRWDFKTYFTNLGFKYDQPVKIKANGNYYLVQVQAIGNIHYGFAGSFGISPVILRIGGGVAQIVSTKTCGFPLASYCDDPEDQNQINRGIDWFLTGRFQ